MPDMIPAARVAAAALHQVEQARNCFPTSYHETEKAMQGKIHLQVASELLALIAPATTFHAGGAVGLRGTVLLGEAVSEQTITPAPRVAVPQADPGDDIGF